MMFDSGVADRVVELLPSGDINGRDRERLTQMEHDVDWGTPAGTEPLRFGDGDRWRVLVRDGGQIASTVQILERSVMVGERPLTVAGIAGVMTAVDFRGRGHASAAMERAATFLTTDRGMTFALLVCWPSRVSFYERLGWRVHHGETVCEQPGGTRIIDLMRVMILDGDQCPLPDVRIDLRGLPW